MDPKEMKERAEAMGLKPVQAFVPAERAKRSGSAERVARMRERQREAGLVQVAVPGEVAEAVKAAGGWEAWRARLVDVATVPGWRGWLMRWLWQGARRG